MHMSFFICNFAKNINIYEMSKQEALEKLRTLDLKHSTSEAVSALFSIIEDIPAVVVTLPKGSKIITRTRMGRGFVNSAELSYCPASRCSTIQRATLPYETAFYGCIADEENHLENGRILGISECSYLAQQGIDSIGREHITASQWEITKPIKVISFINDNTFPKTNNRSKIVELFVCHYKFNDVKDSHFVHEIGDFLTSEFCKKVAKGCDYEYLITATIIHDLLYSTEHNFDAVAYPSVPAEGQLGINIAIKPSAADTKLALYRVIEQSFFKYKDKSILRIDRGFDNHRHLLSGQQYGDDVVCEQLGIKSIKELPFIKH